jgi:superfamily II DNA or RNA helicase
MNVLRPYQTEFLDAVQHCFDEGNRRILGVAATGAGKTILAAELMRREQGNCLFLADAKELINQNADKYFTHTGERAGVEMGAQTSRIGVDRVVVATSQSLHRRLEKFEEDHFNLVIVDECFPAGTLVDGRPIEDFEIGDPITAFDEESGELVSSFVTDVMRTQSASPLYEISTSSHSVAATAGHPFWTKSGWKNAMDVRVGDFVLIYEKTKDTNDGDMRDVRRGVPGYILASEESCIQTECGVDVLSKMPVPPLLGVSEGSQSHVRSCNPNKGVEHSSRNEVGTNGSWRQRKTHAAGATPDCGNARLGDGGCGPNEDAEGEWIPDLLQIGHRELESEDRSGDQRQLPQHGTREVSRQEEGGSLIWSRVEGHHRLEVGRDSESGENRGSNQVFNLTVAKYSTYIANGIVVHNCHRNSLGDAPQKIFKHFSYAKVLGITATPFRSDRKELGNFFEKIAIDIGLDRLIREGYLSRIQIKSFPMSVDLREVKMSGGDYSTSDLGAVIEPILQEAANQLVTHAADRKKIVIFLPLVKTSIRMARILNDMGIKAVHVSGEDRESLREFTHGDARVICNAQLLTTGWDCPHVDCVLVLRPTKSLSLYSQMVGRGTRIHADKDKLLLLDPLFLTDDHRLITPARLVARDEEQAKAMMEKIAEDGGGDLLGVEVDIEEKRADALRARMEAKQKKKGRVVDAIEFAMSCGDMETAEFQPEFGWEANPPSPKQLDALTRAGFDTDEITTRGQASKVLDLLFLRRQKGLATPKQLKLMKQHGHPAPAEATFDAASKWIDAKFASFGAGRGQAQALPTSLLIRLRAAGLRAKDYATKDSAEAALREIGAAA